MPHHEIGKFFERAAVFVNTSRVEGFPNTFLQSWANYTPVVSLNVDPDSIIQRKKLGFCSKAFKQLVSDVNTLLENDKLRERMGKNARIYFENEHDIRKTTRLYIDVLKSVQSRGN